MTNPVATCGMTDALPFPAAILSLLRCKPGFHLPQGPYSYLLMSGVFLAEHIEYTWGDMHRKHEGQEQLAAIGAAERKASKDGEREQQTGMRGQEYS